MRRTLALFVTAIALASPAYAALELPSPRERWISIKADEFEIFSNASDRETTAAAAHLLRMRDAIGSVTMLRVRAGLPTKVYIFRDRRNFAPYRSTIFPRGGENTTGIFMAGHDANYILLTADNNGDIDRVVYHELTHYFLNNTLSGLPLWFNEGFAEYYSTFRMRGDEVDVGMIIPEHVSWLRNGGAVIPLSELFAITTKSIDYNEGTRQGVFYAESWALVHYLMADAERRQQLGTYLNLVARQSVKVDDALRTAFGKSFDELERALRSYIKSYAFQYSRFALADLHPAPVPAAQPIGRDEVLYQLGDLLVHNGRSTASDGERFLSEALKANPDHAGAHASLGFAAELAGRKDDAIAEYEKAVKLGGRDANVYLLYGVALLERLEATARGTDSAPAADVARARALFAKAAELAPSSARAYAGLGMTYLLTQNEDAGPGIAALEKSLTLSPAQKDVQYNLVGLYARAGRREDAVRLTETVIARSGDADILRQAREAVLIGDVEQGQNLLNAGNITDAEPLLRRAHAATSNERLKAYLADTLARLDGFKARKTQLDALNAAVALANSGKIAEALTAVDTLIPSITDAQLLSHARQFRDELSKAKKK
jgi:Flp pilus assembly protein TadD